MNAVIDGGATLGGRLTWVHVRHGARSRVRFYVAGEFAGSAATGPTPDTEVLGVDVDVVYVRYGREIARFQLESGSVLALDSVPAVPPSAAVPGEPARMSV
ncbi:hypothetical protein GCM10027289_21010 [Tsukamurella serpentis]